MKAIASKQFDGGFTVSIYPDPDADDPRTWGWSEEEMESDGFRQILKQWQDGDIYGYITMCDGIEIDSCWGFYSIEDAYAHANESFPTRANEYFPTRDDQYYFDLYENQ